MISNPSASKKIKKQTNKRKCIAPAGDVAQW
jgi:hypothetical protein